MWGSRLGYSFWMVVAAIIAGWILTRRQRGLPLSSSDKFALAMSGVVGATLAAKLPFMLFAPMTGPVWTAWIGDGKTLLWALAGGYAGVEVGKQMLGIRSRTGDTFVVAVAVAVAIGRLGCFSYGCCHGTPTELPWGVGFVTAEDGGSIARHPTQLYESLFHFVAAAAAAGGIAAGRMLGDWMPLYLAAYAVYRFFAEFLRPEPEAAWGLTFYQLSAVPIALVMLGIVVARGIRARGSESGTRRSDLLPERTAP